MIYIEDKEMNKELIIEKYSNVYAPLQGKIIPIENVKDEMFSQKMLGDGIAIMPFENSVYAPIDGIISCTFPTLHAIGIRTKNGIDLLIHIGINTCNLKGKYFKCYAKENQNIKIGDKLVEFDKNSIEKEGYDPVMVIVITNSDDCLDIKKMKDLVCSRGDVLMRVKK